MRLEILFYLCIAYLACALPLLAVMWWTTRKPPMATPRHERYLKRLQAKTWR